MRSLLGILLICALVQLPGGPHQDQPTPVSLVELIANPQEFDGRVVVVRGFFLVVGRPHDLVGYYLFLHKEDAENNLGNDVAVVPNDQMTRDQEKIDRMYVQLTGTFRVVRAAGNDLYVSSIRDVTSCSVWSDPSHPIGLKQLDRGRYR